jgi:iron complex transport system ATP-binding protein
LDKKTNIRAKNLAVGYNGKAVLSELNFEILSGELICLLGANGKGKSTLLKTLMGLLPILSGSVLLKEKLLSSISAEDKAKEMAVVLTDSLRDVNMKAEEVVATGRYPYLAWNAKLSTTDKEFIKTSLLKVGANHLSNRWMMDLSDGERQRVIIARALAQQTPILLLDEPTAFLDLAHTMELSVLLKKLGREEGKSILMSTHDWATALQIADRIFWIDENSSFHILKTKELIEGDLLNKMLNTPFGIWNNTLGRFEIKEG